MAGVVGADLEIQPLRERLPRFMKKFEFTTLVTGLFKIVHLLLDGSWFVAIIGMYKALLGGLEA